MDAVEIFPAHESDRDGLTELVRELKNYERYLHQARQPGDRVAADHVDYLIASAEEGGGAIFIAWVGEDIAGFVAGWMALDQDPLNFPELASHGYISDIFVLPRWRGKDIAQQLLGAIEAHLRTQGARRLRIHSLARNAAALAAYRGCGFDPLEIVLEKPL
ncbi:GNAT family N-acetyltransferase [Nisaea acidiphila]|uniref:GNAT family N-acetyltransferase n=1 Tax=Nisaea acidiphila TaxID=1862145 RepID=A0A9J7AQV7_9PROT|nr:GNAT family N-acetyltransferase [Nisaea acidiphila]UUX49566.1 GNAT family N-acetyltransferase [Nisaea acidiphila]